MQATRPPTTSAFKLIERRKNEWRCLLCCHVRTGTIFFGLWHLMLQLLAIITMGVFLLYPELLKPIQIGKASMVERDVELPTALAERNAPAITINSFSTDGAAFTNYNGEADIIEPTADSSKNREYYASYGIFIGRPLQYEELSYIIVILFCSIVFTISMIYGAIKGRPKLLIPFFFMQLFDLFVTILSALGYICYLPDLRRLIVRAECQYIPTTISPQYVSLIIILSLTITIISKGYFVAVVWSCYKYLTLKRASAQPTIHYIESNFVVQNLLRPDCDFNMKKFPPPPPSYAVAVAGDNASHPEVPPPPYNSN